MVHLIWLEFTGRLGQICKDLACLLQTTGLSKFFQLDLTQRKQVVTIHPGIPESFGVERAFPPIVALITLIE